MTATATAPVEPAASLEALEESIVRLSDAIGSLKPSRWGKHAEIDRVRFEVPGFPSMNMHTLAELVKLPEAKEVVRAKCNHCQTVVSCPRFAAPRVACDECREKAVTDAALARHKRYWEHVCPERFRTTDVKHASFPAAIFRDLRKEDPKRSLFLYGPTGTGKTRVAMLLLQWALSRDQRAAVLWPEKLRTLTSFDNSTFDQYAAYDVLLLDDVLLTACRESKLVDALKQLVDVRMRHERPFIVTSQIGTEQDIVDGKEFGEAKTADMERIKALVRRLREECRVVSFAKAEATEGESAF